LLGVLDNNDEPNPDMPLLNESLQTKSIALFLPLATKNVMYLNTTSV
jgi:hypothetical protein